MLRYILVGLGGGVLFGMMDGAINANPLAQRLLQAYGPIAKAAVNVPAGILIDLVYGYALTGIFLVLYGSLPGHAGWIKGLSFGLLAWFFRVLMGAISQWMVYTIPIQTLGYQAAAGLFEMMVLGVYFGLLLRPRN